MAESSVERVAVIPHLAGKEGVRPSALRRKVTVALRRKVGLVNSGFRALRTIRSGRAFTSRRGNKLATVASDQRLQ